MSPATVSRLDAAQVLETLAQLDEIYQAPVALFYLQDCSYNEIAEILEVPLGTVKSRLARGLGRLHQMLAGDAAGRNPATKIMNRDEAKNILLLYRPGTADAEDPQIAEALALAEQTRSWRAGWRSIVRGRRRCAPNSGKSRRPPD